MTGIDIEKIAKVYIEYKKLNDKERRKFLVISGILDWVERIIQEEREIREYEKNERLFILRNKYDEYL